MPVPAQTIHADLLTRTTLQIDPGSTMASIAQLVKALQRVPGVLLAEVADGDARAIVAHDSAVPVTALLAAAAGAGAQTRIVSVPQVTDVATNSALLPTDASNRRLLMLAAALLFVFALTETLVPRLATNHFVLPILLSTLWACVVARMILRRSR